MMVYWNCREILDVYPEELGFTCVGSNKNAAKRTGARCTQYMFALADKRRAGELLNAMDRCKSLKSSYQDLDELAYLTLCPRLHRKPDHRNQVDEVSRKWRIKIARYEKQQVQNEVIEASICRANKKPVESKKTLTVFKDEPGKAVTEPLLTAPKPDILKKRDKNVPFATLPSTIKSSLDDPVTGDSKASSAIKLAATSSRSVLQEPRLSLVPIPPLRSEVPKVEREEYKLPALPVHHSGLPTLPETSESSQQAKDDVVDEIPPTPTKSIGNKTLEQSSVTSTTTIITMTAIIPSSATAPPETSAKNSENINKSVRQSESLIYRNEESFGYAIITPEVARYKTYLPALASHGLLTPPGTPGTPGTLPQLKINTGPFEESFSVRPVVSRKPLPNVQKMTGDTLAGEVRSLPNLCMKCPDNSCHCHEMIEDEVRAGCFHGLGLKLLKMRVARKMKILKTRITIMIPKRDKW